MTRIGSRSVNQAGTRSCRNVIEHGIREDDVIRNQNRRQQYKAIAKAAPFPYWTILYGMLVVGVLLWLRSALTY